MGVRPQVDPKTGAIVSRDTTVATRDKKIAGGTALSSNPPPASQSGTQPPRRQLPWVDPKTGDVVLREKQDAGAAASPNTPSTGQQYGSQQAQIQDRERKMLTGTSSSTSGPLQPYSKQQREACQQPNPPRPTPPVRPAGPLVSKHGVIVSSAAQRMTSAPTIPTQQDEGRKALPAPPGGPLARRQTVAVSSAATVASVGTQ